MTRDGEPWAERLDCAHPVRWSPADGDTPRYLTLAGAVERLSRDGGDADAIRAGLLAGQVYRTAFAFYKIDAAGAGAPPICADCGHPFEPEYLMVTDGNTVERIPVGHPDYQR